MIKGIKQKEHNNNGKTKEILPMRLLDQNSK